MICGTPTALRCTLCAAYTITAARERRVGHTSTGTTRGLLSEMPAASARNFDSVATQRFMSPRCAQMQRKREVCAWPASKLEKASESSGAGAATKISRICCMSP
jgi:hypothetical protein